jgi:hypothetical protein
MIIVNEKTGRNGLSRLKKMKCVRFATPVSTYRLTRFPPLQPQEPVGIAVADLGTRRRGFDESCGGLPVFIGIVDGEHHAVLAERHDGFGERPRGANARCGDDEVVPDDGGGQRVRREFFAELALPSAVEAPQQERKRLVMTRSTFVARLPGGRLSGCVKRRNRGFTGPWARITKS